VEDEYVTRYRKKRIGELKKRSIGSNYKKKQKKGDERLQEDDDNVITV